MIKIQKRLQRTVGALSVLLGTLLWFSLLYSWRRRLIYEIDGASSPPTSHPPPPPQQSFDGSTNHTAKRILIVSGLFQLSKSKHSWDLYEWTLKMFVGRITTDVYFYTSPDLERKVHRVHSHSPASSSFLKTNSSYTTPFGVPPMTDLKQTYEGQHRFDRERDIHGPELYAVWNAKPFFVDAAVKEMRRSGREYDYVFWVDAGTFRQTHMYQKWPDPSRVDEFFQEALDTQGAPPEKQEKDVILFPINDAPSYWYRHWKENMGPVDFIFSKGSFFGGSPTALEWYSDTFYAYHNYFLSLGYFVGKDQNIINALLLLFPHRFAVQWQRDPRTAPQLLPRGKCGMEWYYYLHVLANQVERDAMERSWKERMDGIQEGKLWRKAHELHPDAWRRCPISSGISFQRIAQDTFRYGWERARTTVVSR